MLFHNKVILLSVPISHNISHYEISVTNKRKKYHYSKKKPHISPSLRLGGCIQGSHCLQKKSSIGNMPLK